MPVPESTAMITTPPDATTDDGFDIGEIEKRMNPESAEPDQEHVGDEPEPEVTPEPEAKPEPEPEAEPKAKNVLDMTAEFPEPVGGKYKTLGDLVKAFESQTALIGKQGTEIEKAKDALALMELVRTDPDAAKAQIDKLRVPPEELTLQEAIELNANPSAFIAKKVTEILSTQAERQKAEQGYTDALKKVYPSFDQMAQSRTQVQAAHEQGLLGDVELYHLAALGRAVRDGKLTLDGTKVETTPAIEPSSAGAGKAPKTPTKPKPEADPRDAFIEDLEHSGAMI